MNKDRVKGKLVDVKGRIKRQVGEWTGDEKAQAKGAAEQVRGKIQNAWGKATDAAHANVLRKVNRKKDKRAA